MRFGKDEIVFDFRVLLTNARNARDAGILMWEMVRHLRPEVLIGPGFGSAPLLHSTALAALADGVELQTLMVRDQRKGHNLKRWVEGDHAAASGKRAVLIDDFMLAGSVMGLVEKALASDKVRVSIVALALFFDMWSPLGSRQISMSKHPVLSLFTRHDVGLSRDAFDATPPLMKGASADFIGAEPKWWRMQLNRETGYPTKCAPVIHEGGAFVADDRSRLWRHDLHTGDIDWRVDSLAEPHKGVVQLLTAAQDSVVFACYDGTVTRVHARSGAIIWRWKVDSSIHATPWVDLASRRVFINTEQWNGGAPTGHIQCLDWDSGRVLWKRQHAWWPPGSAIHDSTTDLVVAPANDASMGAWDAQTGEARWVVKSKGLVRGRPALSHSGVFAATEDGHLHHWDLATGEQRWTVRYGKGLWHQFLHTTDRHAVVMDGKWHVAGFDLQTGELAWITRLRSPGCWAPVRCGRHLVFLSREGHLAVIDPQREIKVWEGRIPGSYHQPPALAGGVLLAASNDSGLLAFDIDSSYEH